MKVELWGGPRDGMVIDVADDNGGFVFAYGMPMTPNQMVAMEEYPTSLPMIELAWVDTKRINTHTGAHIFRYAGERTKL